MRIRVNVQRHALPPVKVLWPVVDAGILVSELLAQLNESVPLESGTWGLEDYVVEVNGYECLHYCQVSSVLKNDDEVM